ncbi:uncharacterized protein DEA37_0012700 [Paragonimus westermani]|uniref:Uncharacterized protein n=1 Tax=Paragonimus westermani TaxID=34504 RepID=A0A5J4NHE3_9TREM|nr:uncharacterized protein DEA37_0012700 [Paragonimus westermani]
MKSLDCDEAVPGVTCDTNSENSSEDEQMDSITELHADGTVRSSKRRESLLSFLQKSKRQSLHKEYYSQQRGEVTEPDDIFRYPTNSSRRLSTISLTDFLASATVRQTIDAQRCSSGDDETSDHNEARRASFPGTLLKTKGQCCQTTNREFDEPTEMLERKPSTGATTESLIEAVLTNECSVDFDASQHENDEYDDDDVFLHSAP